MARRSRKRSRAPRPIVFTREAEARMRDMDRHHSTDPRARNASIESIMSGETPLGKVIRGRIIA